MECDDKLYNVDHYNIELNSDLKRAYIVKGNTASIQYDEQVKLEKLRNENHKRYHKINIIKISNLPNEFTELKEDIFDLYNCIDSSSLLINNMIDALNNKKILDNIYKKYSILVKII